MRIGFGLVCFMNYVMSLKGTSLKLMELQKTWNDWQTGTHKIF